MLNTLFFVFLKFLNCGERHVRCTTLNIFKFHSTALNTFALLCNQPQKSSSCWTEQSPDRYNRLGVTVTRLARGSLPTPARRQVPSTITQKLNRQPRACAATAQSRGHTAAGPPPAAEGLPHRAAAVCRQRCCSRAMPRRPVGPRPALQTQQRQAWDAEG